MGDRQASEPQILGQTYAGGQRPPDVAIEERANFREPNTGILERGHACNETHIHGRDYCGAKGMHSHADDIHPSVHATTSNA